MEKRLMHKYNFYYWGPLLFKVKMVPRDLKKCVKLCSKKSTNVKDTLAGVIKHEHTVSPGSFVSILLPYLSVFRQCYEKWYGRPLTRKLHMLTAWVNFMKAGEFNPPHIHSKCDFSSVLFIKIPEKLKEEHKKYPGTGSGPGSICFSYGEMQPTSIVSKSFFPEEGDLFIFPATLTHFVAPFLSKGERISMSANLELN